ncbi:MAG: IreB family regulatory phosphoprotein [Oscillospiraceae bacterium]|nr:IreB family regulatory phosphoprotein [Oscillospiraceae bacterium]
MNQAERKAIMDRIYASLTERGYRPIDQLIGYILTGDPTYITNHSGARQLAADVDRYDLLQDMLRAYLLADETVERSA